MRVKESFQSLLQLWNQFWFGPIDLYNLGLFRCILFSVLFVMDLLRFIEVRLLYFNSGLMPASQAADFPPEFYKPLLFWFPHSDAGVVAVHVALLSLLLLGALGLLGRSLTWLVLVLHLAILQRNYTVMYGADFVTSFWLFYLSFTQHNKCFRIKKGEVCPVARQNSDIFTSMGYRLIQIQLCIIYGYTGMEKLKGSTWWEGTAVWKVLGNTQIAPMDFSFLVHFPWLVALMTYSTLLFEVYFPAVVWYKPLRPYWLALGAGFHLMAALTMGLHFFSLVMVCGYVLFLRLPLKKEEAFS